MKEEKLLKNLKRKQRYALDKAIQIYSGYVAAVIRDISGRALSREDCEEVAADSFLALWDHAGSLDESRDSIKGYLAAIARNKTISRLRKRREEPLEADELILRAPGKEEPEETLIRRELGQVLRQMVNDMEEPDREIFICYYYRYEKVKDIARRMKMNPSTVKTKLARGRKRLKEMLCERGYDCEV